MGAYTKKSGCELCLIATKGKDAHKLVINHKVNSFIEFPRMEHSKKPDLIRQSIEDLCGEDRDKIELFARQNSPGWDVFGNQVENSKKKKKKIFIFLQSTSKNRRFSPNSNSICLSNKRKSHL